MGTAKLEVVNNALVELGDEVLTSLSENKLSVTVANQVYDDVYEDLLGKARTVRCAVASFATIGALIEGTALLATVPELVAAQLRATHPRLRTAPVPLPIAGSAIELLWPAAADDDPVGQFVRGQIVAIAGRLPRGGAVGRR